MVDENSLYDLLGLSRDASPEEVRRAYHLAARRLHPDVNLQPGDTELFLGIQQAYDILSDPVSRSQYDSILPAPRLNVPPLVVNACYSRGCAARLNEPQLIYTLLELKANQDPSAGPRPPINLCLVIDRSTSMQGARMDTVKASAIELVRQLYPDDSLSVVTFSDRAEVLIPAAWAVDRAAIQTSIQMIQTGGGTEMLHGLESGFREALINYNKRSINHIILLTDGRTYGDEAGCEQIAWDAARKGIGISCLGIGEEWNDAFLDRLSARTGGGCHYVSSPADIQVYLKEKFFNLGQVFAENISLSFTSSPEVELRYAFRLAPEVGPLFTRSPIQLGNLTFGAGLTLLLEFTVTVIPTGVRQINLAQGGITFSIPSQETAPSELPLALSVAVEDLPDRRPAPTALLRALSKLTLYRMQERAELELAEGRIQNAKKQLHHLATHLFSQGEAALARSVLLEAENLEQGGNLSEKGRKEIKYRTRALLLPAAGGTARKGGR